MHFKLTTVNNKNYLYLFHARVLKTTSLQILLLLKIRLEFKFSTNFFHFINTHSINSVPIFSNTLYISNESFIEFRYIRQEFSQFATALKAYTSELCGFSVRGNELWLLDLADDEKNPAGVKANSPDAD